MFDITEQHDGGGGDDSSSEVIDAPPRSLSPRKPRTNVSTPEMRFHANLSLRKLSRVFTLPYRQAGFLDVTTHKRSSPLRPSPRCRYINAIDDACFERTKLPFRRSWTVNAHDSTSIVGVSRANYLRKISPRMDYPI